MNGPTAAASAQRTKGPIVWLDMDQQALDDAYDQLVYAPNRDQLSKRRVANSAAARTRIGDPLRFRLWADADRRARCLSRLPPPNPPPQAAEERRGTGRDLRPWRRLAHQQRADYSYGAEPFVRAGGHFVVLDFITVMTPAAACFRWWSRCAARSPGSIATPQVRRRPRPALSDLAFLRRASRRLRPDARLAEGGLAERRHQGRDAARACTISSRCGCRRARICEIHRRDGGGAERAAPSRRSWRR